MAQIATPLSLIALGMGLVEYGVRGGWQISTAITVLKLIVQPLVVWGLARLLGLPEMETRAVIDGLCLGSVEINQSCTRCESTGIGPVSRYGMTIITSREIIAYIYITSYNQSADSCFCTSSAESNIIKITRSYIRPPKY